VREILAAHCRARESLSTLRARFTQTKVFTAIGLEERSTGTLHYRRPDAFRWEYAPPDGSFTVVTGRTGWAVFPRIRQARRIRLEDARREGLLSLVGFGPCSPAFAESFELAAVPGRGEGVVLSMKPLRPEVAALFTAVELTLDPRDDLPRSVVLDEATGDRTRFEFLDVRRDVRIEGSLFQFTPPGDYEVFD
jgi:outer membrane lipoprotein carrier protein